MAPLNFVIDNFETVINLDVSGIMVGEAFAIDASDHELHLVSTASLKQSFRIQSDSSDVLNVDDSDIKFYLDTDSFWNAGFGVNPADADVQSTVPSGGTGPIASGFPANKNMVCHDFVRYIAEQLFNTHHGVDLLDNERELLIDIRDKARGVWTKMETELALYGDGVALSVAGTHPDMKTDSAGAKYSQNDLSTSIVRRVYEQMINSAEGRARFKTGVVSDSLFSLPFEDNDTIELKLIINVEPDQHTLTNLGSSIGPRSYKIIYKLASSGVTPTRDADEDSAYLTRL